MEKNIVFVNEPIKLVDNDKIRIKGRYTVSEEYLAFDWTNSGFTFAFNGTGFVLSLGEYTADIPAYVKITVDGKQKYKFAVVNGSEKLIVEGLSDKRHRVEVLKVTEGDAKLLFDTITLFGLNASLRNPPFNSPRKIEFIGDSMTAGYGVLGPSTETQYLTYQQDGTCTYAYLTVEKCNAEARFICNSGKGIVCNCNGDREDVKAGEYYEYQTRLGGVCNDGWIPDVVVINIGTNDCGGPASDEEFTEAAKDLIAKVRARYNDAHIIWMYGMMSQLYKDVLRKLIREVSKTDEKVHFLFADTIIGNEAENGSNGHPNMRASVRCSKLLYKKIRSVTGWKNDVVIPDEE